MCCLHLCSCNYAHGLITIISAYLVWIGLAAYAFQEMATKCEQSGIAKLAESFTEAARLFNLALQCEEVHARISHPELQDGADGVSSLQVGVNPNADKIADGDTAVGASGQRVCIFLLFVHHIHL